MSFKDAVYQVVQAIPAGYVLTYGEVATQAGNPRAARAVGTLMRSNHKSFLTHANDPQAVPCHRVVGAGYQLGDFNGGLDAKIQLLTSEGWRITNQRLERR